MSTTPMARTAAQAAPPRKDKKAGTHQATHSIRAKAASSGVGGRAQDKGKGRDAGLSGNSKVVYKALLESPLNVKWPSLPAHLQETVVHTLCSMLAGAAEHHLTQGRLNRKDKPVDPKRGTRRNRANPKTASNLTQAQTDSPAANAEGGASRPAEGSSSTETGSKEPAPGNTSKDKTPKPGRPPILDHIVLGINENTDALSANPRSKSKAAPPAVPVAPVTETAPVATTSTAAPVPRSPDDALKYVFVCLADINPTSLVAHIPAMVAGFNGRAKASGAADSRGVRVMTLAKGAEALLAQAFGIRRAAVVGVKWSCPPEKLAMLDALVPVGVLPPLLVQHLIPPPLKRRPTINASSMGRGPAFIATQPGALTASSSTKLKTGSAATIKKTKRPLAPLKVKMVKTTMPKDMKAAKAARTKAVAERRKVHKKTKVLEKRGKKKAKKEASGKEGEKA